jgi:hypothetical protein
LNYLLRSGEQYHHLCHSVGVAFIRLNMAYECDDGFAHLQEIIATFDQVRKKEPALKMVQIVEQFEGIEKIKNSSLVYIVAVGVLPDSQKNVCCIYSSSRFKTCRFKTCLKVDSPPITIGDLLTSLTLFLLKITAFCEDQDIECQIGEGQFYETIILSDD